MPLDPNMGISVNPQYSVRRHNVALPQLLQPDDQNDCRWTTWSRRLAGRACCSSMGSSSEENTVVKTSWCDNSKAVWRADGETRSSKVRGSSAAAKPTMLETGKDKLYFCNRGSWSRTSLLGRSVGLPPVAKIYSKAVVFSIGSMPTVVILDSLPLC